MSKLKRYRLRIPAISLLWGEIEAENPRDAVRRWAKKLNSKTVEYDDPRCYEVEEIKDE